MRMLLLAAVAASAALFSQPARAQHSLLNVSYDPTREFYAEVNKTFDDEWQKKTGEVVVVRSSHNGSGAQARAVIDGLEADVVTLALAGDIDAIAQKAHLLPDNWQTRLPNNSTPYTSTIVFLVRKGNPKHIKDWGDLIKPDVSVIVANPKTSGGARWAFLAAWAYGRKAGNGDEAKAQAYVAELYKHVPILDTGARGSTITFVERKQGDVLLAWENEAFLATKQMSDDGFEIVVPTISVLAEPPVALVDQNVDRHGTRKIAEAYLQFLYTPEGQELAAKHYYRPRSAEVLARHAASFPTLELVSIDSFGGWKRAQPTYFGDGGVFDHIYPGK